MLDTVLIRGHWPLHKTLLPNSKIPISTSITAWTDDLGKSLKRIQFSAAKVLHGTNGSLIENQAQLDASLSIAVGLLSKTATLPASLGTIPYRLDLAWNYQLPAARLILAHYPKRIPGIRKASILYDEGGSVSWRGSRSKFSIKLYDKCKEMRVRGSVLRAEVSLCGPKLLKHLDGRDWFDFNVLWQIYRNIMTTIPPIAAATSCKNWREAMGQLPPAFRDLVLSKLVESVSQRTFRRYRLEVETAAAKFQKPFSWSEILPADAPPAAIHVMKKRKIEHSLSTPCHENSNQI